MLEKGESGHQLPPMGIQYCLLKINPVNFGCISTIGYWTETQGSIGIPYHVLTILLII